MNQALIDLSLRVLHLETVNILNAVAEAERDANEVGNAAAYSEAALRSERIQQRTSAMPRIVTEKHVAKINQRAADALHDCADIDIATASRVIAAIAVGRIPGVSIAY